MDIDSVLAIAPSLLGVGLAAFFLGAAFSRVFPRRPDTTAHPSAASIVRDLCALNARLAEDPTLAELVLRYVETPAQLDRVDRVRARAWFDGARRLHALLAEALEREPALAERRERFAPSMGEGAGDPCIVAARDFAPPRLSNVTLIDPEFMACVEAMRGRRGARFRPGDEGRRRARFRPGDGGRPGA